jgi:hypothetical protein
VRSTSPELHDNYDSKEHLKGDSNVEEHVHSPPPEHEDFIIPRRGSAIAFAESVIVRETTPNLTHAADHLEELKGDEESGRIASPEEEDVPPQLGLEETGDTEETDLRDSYLAGLALAALVTAYLWYNQFFVM